MQMNNALFQDQLQRASTHVVVHLAAGYWIYDPILPSCGEELEKS